jgi:hypothetical protein
LFDGGVHRWSLAGWLGGWDEPSGCLLRVLGCVKRRCRVGGSLHKTDMAKVVFYTVEFISGVANSLKEYVARGLLFEDVASLRVEEDFVAYICEFSY